MQELSESGSVSGSNSAPITGSSKDNGKALLARWWAGLDTKYMKPFLTHARPTLLETLPVCCNPLARLLTTTEQLTQVAFKNHGKFLSEIKV